MRISTIAVVTATLLSSIAAHAEELPGGVLKRVQRAPNGPSSVSQAAAAEALDCDFVSNACLLDGPFEANLPIPDQGKASDFFPVTRGTLEGFFGTTNCTIARAKAAVELRHGDVGDLQLTLKRSDLSLLLADFASGCNASRLDASFSDTGGAAPNTCGITNGASQRPAQALSALNGRSPLETYTLDVVDTENGDAGTFERWAYALDLTCSPLAPPATCSGSPTAVCLQGGRFRVTTEYRTGPGASGAGGVFPMTADTAAFTFFSPSNVEVVVKVLNGCGLNNRYWVFMAGLTNVRVYVTVVDINGGGNSITYISPVNTDFAPVYDTEAFPCS